MALLVFVWTEIDYHAQYISLPIYDPIVCIGMFNRIGNGMNHQTGNTCNLQFTKKVQS